MQDLQIWRYFVMNCLIYQPILLLLLQIYLHLVLMYGVLELLLLFLCNGDSLCCVESRSVELRTLGSISCLDGWCDRNRWRVAICHMPGWAWEPSTDGLSMQLGRIFTVVVQTQALHAVSLCVNFDLFLPLAFQLHLALRLTVFSKSQNNLSFVRIPDQHQSVYLFEFNVMFDLFYSVAVTVGYGVWSGNQPTTLISAFTLS